MKLNAKQIATATGGRFLEESLDTNTFINRCVYNHKKVCKNDLFAAIADANYNGHNYIEPAIYSGAKVILVERPVKPELLNLASLRCCNVIEVDDIIYSLQNIAKYWMHKNPKKSVAVYGPHNIAQNFDHQVTFVERPSASLFNLCLNLQKNIVITELNTYANISVPLTLINSEHDTDMIILDAMAPDYQTLRQNYKLGKPNYAVVTDKLPDEIMFNVVNNLPDIDGVLMIAKHEYNEIKDKYLRQAVERGVKVVVFGELIAAAKAGMQQAEHASLQVPEVYFEVNTLGSEPCLQDMTNCDDGTQDNANANKTEQITVTIHADGFSDPISGGAINQVTHITLPKNSLDFINEFGGFVALNCMLGLSLYDIKALFKC